MPKVTKKTIKGFKGFDKGLECRGFKFKEGKTFEQSGDPEICANGFHFCKNPLDVFNYYPPKIGAEYAEVEADSAVSDRDKSCSSKISIKTRLSIAGLFKAHFDLVKESAAASTNANTSGYKAHANTSGYEAHANTSGYKAHANTSGYKAHANTSGNEAHANTSGNEAHANTSGNKAHANTSGNEAHANTSGYEAISCSIGIQSKASAIKGWIIITDWRYKNEWIIENIYSAKVGAEILGVKIEPSTSYWFENGDLKSEKI